MVGFKTLRSSVFFYSPWQLLLICVIQNVHKKAELHKQFIIFLVKHFELVIRFKNYLYNNMIYIFPTQMEENYTWLVNLAVVSAFLFIGCTLS